MNHLSLRALAALDPGTWDTTGGYTRSVLRTVFLAVSTTVFVGLTLRALRGRTPVQAALIGLLLIPVLFYPANYYFHFVFLLPLLAATDGARPRDAWIWALLLAMCVAEYPAAVAETFPGHFAVEAFVLLVTFFALVTRLALEKTAERTLNSRLSPRGA